LLYLWSLDDLQNYFKRGGKIWDTMLAEYIISGQQHKFPALRDIAVNKYGCKERTKEMEEYWNKGIDTSDIPKELVLKDVEQDVLDTEQIYLAQLEKAKYLGMTRLIELQGDAILATTEMKYNGLKIDLEVLEANKKSLIQSIKQEEEKLNELVNRYWK